MDYGFEHVFKIEISHHEAVSVCQEWVAYKSDESCDVEQRHYGKDAVSFSWRICLELLQLVALGDDIVVAVLTQIKYARVAEMFLPEHDGLWKTIGKGSCQHNTSI